ncbi:MAG: hypothetical protein ABIJ96_04885 [Elusimicrobiota bacterium]
MRDVPALLAALLLSASPLWAGDGFPDIDPKNFSFEEIAAALQHPEIYTLDPASIKLEELGPAGEAPAGGMPFPASAACGEPAPELIDPSTIINIGKELWRIIEANKPVVDTAQSYATAMPQGIKDPSQLQGWRPPQGTVYRLTAENFWKWRVIDLKFQVLRTWGGACGDTGRYLTAVTTEPLLINVIWGYRFSLNASVPPETITNVGTVEDPLAAMTHTLKLTIKTAIKEVQGAYVFHLRGDGTFQQLGSPFPARVFAEARESVNKLREPVRWD